MSDRSGKGKAILVVAGSDSSGEAGLQRDLQVAWEARIAARSAVTALTAQSTDPFFAVFPMSSESVRQQIRAGFALGPLDAVKVGMLANTEIVSAVFDELADSLGLPVIVDPVLASSSGTQLLDEGGRLVLKEKIARREGVLLTPNIPELSILLAEKSAQSEEQLVAQARRLHEGLGCSVLAKGGHAEGANSCDVLVTANGDVSVLRLPRLAAQRRGTGCALSTRIACALAEGSALEDAVRVAKDFVFSELLEKKRAEQQRGYSRL